MMIRQSKSWLWGGFFIVAIIILTIFVAPNNNKLIVGSTYNKQPNGYGAWYEYVSEKGYKIERWQKPFDKIINQNRLKNTTYLRILPKVMDRFDLVTKEQSQWIERGNKLIVLGVRQSVTKAPFTSERSYNNLKVKVQTTRRKESTDNAIIKDNYGSLVWRKKVGQGEIIYAVSPYIAANAYQGVADNYEFLAQLVDKNNQIFVDEYIHGYKDTETKKIEKQGTLTDYFYQTIWLPLGIQSLLIILISILFFWQRFGKIEKIKTEKIDNSQAYIEALAGVLEKAEATNFAIKTINKDEQIKLQKKLGLGRRLLASNIIIAEWGKQTQKSQERDLLPQILQIAQTKKRVSEADLVKWIQQWQKINQQLPK